MFKRPFQNSNTPLNGLRHIQKNLIKQRELLQIVKATLPDNLTTHCLHVSTHNNNVTLFTDSSVWASKLLYLRQSILKALTEHFGEPVHALKVKVLTKQIKHIHKAPKSPSHNVLNALSSSNSTDTADKLSISMSKLIKTLKKNKLLN